MREDEGLPSPLARERFPGRKLLLAALVLGGMTASLGLAPPALARVHVGIGIGVPLFFPPPVVYAPPPPPYYYYPPPPAYAPPPYPPYPPPPPYAASAAPPPPPTAEQDCRDYHSTVIIDGKPQQTVGTVCRQPDGTWRIVR